MFIKQKFTNMLCLQNKTIQIRKFTKALYLFIKQNFYTQVMFTTKKTKVYKHVMFTKQNTKQKATKTLCI